MNDGVRPDRGAPEAEPPPNALPAQLVHQLLHQAGVAEDEVAKMTLAEAVDAMAAFWSTPKHH